MRESTIEKELRLQVEAAGGLCLKFVSPGNIGVPDRIVLLPGQPVQFVEVKAPGKRPRESQNRVREEFEARGHKVWVIDSFSGVEKFMWWFK